MLTLIICDLPAACQALGFTGLQLANFCLYCKLQLKNINDLHLHKWEPWTCEEHQRHTIQWRDASSEEMCAEITSKHGVCYSVFLRLPYLNPIWSLCIDPMHAFFLQIISHHCQDMWGMDIGIEDGNGSTSDPLPSEIRSSPEYQRAFLVLHTGTLEALRKYKASTLCHLARGEGLSAKGNKYDRWFENYDNLILPLTIDEQENINVVFANTGPDNTAIAVSEVHTAMEYYCFADSPGAYSDLSSVALTHLYFIKVQDKPVEYGNMNIDEKNVWRLAKMKTIQRYTKKRLIEALMKARCTKGITEEAQNLKSPDPMRFSHTKHVNGDCSKTCVLGRSRLQEIWNNMERTILPFWCSPAPPWIGDKGQGKISTNRWLEQYLNPTLKGTVFEDLTTSDMQSNGLHREECWLEQGVLKHLEELFVHTGKAFHKSTVTPMKAWQYDKFWHCGFIFSPSSFSIRDSHVVIGNRIPGNWCAGQIKQIFTVAFRLSSEVFFVVQRFKEFSTDKAEQDPYCQVPLVGGHLYHCSLEDEIEVVTAQDIVAHFAHTPHDKQTFSLACFHALPLDKVPSESTP
ncbi:hypothetical protein V8E53_013344 [Lactarius tabidus]